MVPKPSERLTCHDALRHPFFAKYGLNPDVIAVEKAAASAAKQKEINGLDIPKGELKKGLSYESMSPFTPSSRKESQTNFGLNSSKTELTPPTLTLYQLQALSIQPKQSSKVAELESQLSQERAKVAKLEELLRNHGISLQ